MVPMKIATWNIERPNKTSKRIPVVINFLQEIDDDILILTETNEGTNPGNQYNFFHTSTLYDGLAFMNYPCTINL